MASTLKSILDALKDGTATARKEALQEFRTAVFADRDLLPYLTRQKSNDKHAYKDWLSIVQALLASVQADKPLLRQKIAQGRTVPATVTSRFTTAVGTVRWIVEEYYEYFSKSVLDSLLDHITSTLLDRRLFDYVSLDYFKTIKSLLLHQPHLDHLDGLRWTNLVEICFNVILDLDLRTPLTEVDEDSEDEQATPSRKGTPLDSDDDDAPSPGTFAQKRRRNDKDVLPQPTMKRAGRTRRQGQIPVKPAQVECAIILSLLLCSHNNPMSSPSTKIDDNSTPENRIARDRGILNRLRQFLKKYPSESSLLHDFLSCVEGTLDALALNRVRDVALFARETWDGFVGLWGVKDKRLKEKILIVLRALFPFILVEEPVFQEGTRNGTLNLVEGLQKLWATLSGEADSRWGTNGLKLSTLRLQIIRAGDPRNDTSNPFIASTFRSGWDFDIDQALAWGILELQADVAKQLFMFAESMHPATPCTSQRKDKRFRLQNPVSTLLHNIETQILTVPRCYHLQVLLFFVDRHWSIVHDTLKRQIMDTLIQVQNLEDPDVQSWILLNYAAIAYAESHWAGANVDALISSQAPDVLDAKVWDTILQSVVRRINTAAVCRAASHATHSLLISLYRYTPPSGHIFLSSPRVLQEIEIICKDINIEGPHAPYDSVCMLLIECLKIASQDVRLYRLHMEDKVLEWLKNSWVITGYEKTAGPHPVNDLILLLATICGISKPIGLVIRTSLPSCPIVTAMQKESQLQSIRNFMLYAQLPSYKPSEQSKSVSFPTSVEPGVEPADISPLSSSRRSPNAREGRVLSFLERMIKALKLHWQSTPNPTIEVARRTLDFAVIAIVFQTMLSVNSVITGKEVLKVGAEVLNLVVNPSAMGPNGNAKWTLAERATLCEGLEPLVWTSDPPVETGWEAVAQPDFSRDGVTRKERSLPSVTDAKEELRRNILRAIWSNSEKEGFVGLLGYIRSQVADASILDNPTTLAMDADDGGAWAVRTSETSTSKLPGEKNQELCRLVEGQLIFTIRVAALSSLLGDSSDVKDFQQFLNGLLNSVEESAPWCLLVVPILLREIDIGSLKVNEDIALSLLNAIARCLKTYNHSYNTEMRCLATRALASTFDLWLTSQTQHVSPKAAQLCSWIATSLGNSRFDSWVMRDACVQFLCRYLSVSGRRSSWPFKGTGEEPTPTSILEKLTTDPDVRVRFRVATAIPMLFAVSRTDNHKLPSLYNEMKDAFSADVDHHCQVLQKDIETGIDQCFGDIVGFHVVVYFFEHDNPNEAAMVGGLATLLGREEDKLRSDFSAHADAIIASMLRTMGDQDYTDNGKIIPALESVTGSDNLQEDSKHVAVFRVLTRYRGLETFTPHEPNSPALPTSCILRGLAWMETVPQACRKATTYHVIHELFASIEDTPLVNEKLRLVNALCLWIAYRHQDFNDVILLYAVLHGASALLRQEVLARAAQSILQWTFRCYHKFKAADSRLSRILIRLSSICHDYAAQVHDPAAVRLGEDLLQWFDAQMVKLSTVPVLLDVICKAMPAWAHRPSAALATVQKAVTVEHLSAILRDGHISSNKFRVVRRLAEEPFHNEIQFPSKAFWRLKESLPPTDKIQVEDIAAFTDLLIAHHGQIDSLNPEKPSLSTIRNRHRQLWEVPDRKGERSRKDWLVMAKESILYGLLALLEHESSSLVHNAYNTLRLMMKELPGGLSAEKLWSREYLEELQLLRHYPRLSSKRPVRSLSLLQESDHYVEMSSKFSDWVKYVSVLISDILSSRDPTYGQLYSILSTDVSTAEEMFPVLVYALLQGEKISPQEGPSPRALLSHHFTKVLQYPNAGLQCVQLIVDAVLHLRFFHPGKGDKLAYNKWLDLDYYLLAQSAVRCGAYTTALLFLEIAPEIHDSSKLDRKIVEEIQYEIYAHVDEPDGFYGIQTDNLHRFLIERFRHEKQWDKAFRFHGAALEAGSEGAGVGNVEGIAQSFHSFGFNHLAIGTLQTSEETFGSRNLSPGLAYQLGWRSATWDLPESDTYTPGASLYHVLRCLHREMDLNALDASIQSALYKEMDQLRKLGTESVTQIREVLQALMSLHQISLWKSRDLQDNLSSKAIDFDKWKDFLSISDHFGFSDVENIMSVRLSLIRSNRQEEEKTNQIGSIASPFLTALVEIEKRCLILLSRAARDSDQTQIALNAVLQAQKLEKTPSLEVSQEYANVLWSLGEAKIAVKFLSDLLMKPASSSLPAPSKAELYSRLGTWISEAYLEKPTDIKTKYFDPAINLLLQAAVSYNSEIWRFGTMESSMRPNEERYKIASRAQHTAKKLLEADKALAESHESTQKKFLLQALKMYSRCLQVTNKYDTEASIKFASLWLSNFDEDQGPEIVEAIGEALEKIPSHKFVFLAHQLSARITKSPSQQTKNQTDLQRLILRLCLEHPFHSVYQVYSLQADDDLSTLGSQKERRQSTRSQAATLGSQVESQIERSEAAQDVLYRLEQGESRQRIEAMKLACKAYRAWARQPLPKDKMRVGVQLAIPPSQPILGLPRMDGLVPVLTADTPIDPTLKYENCVWIHKYENVFETAGGVNCPKISWCYGTDGVRYKQLFKGNDDMRQDAVMEQVFELVNRILVKDRETSRRSLRVRSYKVVPLGKQAGVLEFVSNTSPLRNWLEAGHPIYRPGDISPKEARSKLYAASSRSEEDRIKAYNEVCAVFKPVFRHIFTEKHRNPRAWFATRLRYTRSVAASSIVGHILGLGDRHTSNILLDNTTGEVVHIDLGIAFDQGKLLTIPELVPFRLTRDMVDGMGISGTQGVFQRCAEETLRVLRDGSDIIMTVLEVFKHDPLHSWTASEIKIKRVQQPEAPPTTPASEAGANQPKILPSRFELGGLGIDMTSGTAEEAADRALSSVARKLDKSLSVESTVNELIAIATDPTNLGKIFYGWAPHM
ncbi:atypical/PIKK/ATM protein kinase [Coprinopsis cinerea okayama7|uniref:Serine/threonine-protein kinase Tel1 n=1 Tax=Coprinopsis cinerea (strain Okayama-7 / 130 / ATCC MYA-4618 / FGSC 9003) TaxID=240176 RepID=A8N8W4_COPC7|nr:atypical/PIKK/ATM protein kinase [Coprinopsis cinerea okayama7\|eukprot:XP_001831292.2 atypical/PIKK/ATM protein kinase [Coprinopsis cinerea okayama7\